MMRGECMGKKSRIKATRKKAEKKEEPKVPETKESEKQPEAPPDIEAAAGIRDSIVDAGIKTFNEKGMIPPTFFASISKNPPD